MSPYAQRLVVSIAPADTSDCLTQLNRAVLLADAAEIRVDLAASLDLDFVLNHSPLPLIITYRPRREGGAFAGTERDRLNLLARALRLGAWFIDVEWDSINPLRDIIDSPERIMISRHYFNTVPTTLLDDYEQLQGSAAVVKLVGQAGTVADTAPVLELMTMARTPVLPIAMGVAGRFTRIVGASCVNVAFLYAALDKRSLTAPGQLPLRTLRQRYHLHACSPTTVVVFHLIAPTLLNSRRIAQWNAEYPGKVLHVDIPLHASLAATSQMLARYFPEADVRIQADAPSA